MADPLSLSSGPVAMQFGALAEQIKAGLGETFPILPGVRPTEQIEPDVVNNAHPGLGAKIDVIA